jgi:four helix bundle suffix protein
VGRKKQLEASDPSDPSDRTDQSHYAAWLNNDNPAVVANALICLIHQANYLLDQQIAALERQFINKGGYSERLAAARLEHRREQPKGQGPTCSRCSKPMVLRTARKGLKPGSQFWGCSGYPECTSTLRFDGSDRTDTEQS